MITFPLESTHDHVSVVRSVALPKLILLNMLDEDFEQAENFLLTRHDAERLIDALSEIVQDMKDNP